MNSINFKRKKPTSSIMVLILLIIGVVYAILQANLQINGVAKIKSNSWDVHFDHIQINENSISIGENDSAAVIDPENNCKIDFEVTLSLPGDFYEFTVDVVNAGTIDAMIGTLNKTLKVNNEIVSEVPNYLNYSITYEDGVEILPNHLLSAGNTETYLVRLEFRSDIEELPEATTVVTTLEPQYIQADDTAIYPDHLIQPKVPVTDTIYWALQDNNNDGDYEKLVISDSEVTSSDNYQGSFAGTTVFANYTDVPWILLSTGYGGISHKVEEIKIEGIVAPTSTAYWFRGAGADSQTLEGNINHLNVSNVTNMQQMFSYVGLNATTFDIGDLSSWNTSNITSMPYMFFYAGANASTWNIGDISGWDTSNVTNMSYMFSGAGLSATTWNIGDLSNWDTSNVENMYNMFSYAGENATNFNLNLSGWNTSNVTNMSYMFEYAGRYATTWNIKIPSTNGGSINNTTTRLYGSNTSKYAAPDSGRQFTIA
ncbi:MAG: DUF285 domain-containing protein [Bacilli bacterium]|nr:DUF285 domain-containing protein [Bacilli bacterium]